MKVTALIPDGMIHELKALTHAKTITESLMIAIQDWIALQKIKSLNQKVRTKPLVFQSGFSAENVRQLERLSL